jgi:hypothetical protein
MPDITDEQILLVWREFRYLYNALIEEQTLIEGRVSYYPELHLYGDGEGRVVVAPGGESSFKSVSGAITVIARRRQECAERVTAWRAEQSGATQAIIESVERYEGMGDGCPNPGLDHSGVTFDQLYFDIRDSHTGKVVARAEQTKDVTVPWDHFEVTLVRNDT